MTRLVLIAVLALGLIGCPEERPRGPSTTSDAGHPADVDAGGDAGRGDAFAGDGAASDADAVMDAGNVDAGAGDGGPGDTGPGDVGPGDAGPGDGGPGDGGAGDAGPVDASGADAAASDAALGDASAPDSGPPDSGPDSGPVDAGPPAVTCNEPGLVTRVITDSASVGTPDTYFFDVNPGDPFCAEISGGGSGRWGVTVSNGTSSGIYCSNITPCRVRVAPGDPTLLVTAQTTDIGSYTLIVRLIPR